MEKNKRAFELMETIPSLQRQLESASEELKRIQAKCPHSWSDTISDPIIREAYTIPADRPGTMGIDWRPEFRVPREEKERWKRTCRICGLIQYTDKAQERITRIPSF